jgi:hypothetical protein
MNRTATQPTIAGSMVEATARRNVRNAFMVQFTVQGDEMGP